MSSKTKRRIYNDVLWIWRYIQSSYEFISKNRYVMQRKCEKNVKNFNRKHRTQAMYSILYDCQRKNTEIENEIYWQNIYRNFLSFFMKKSYLHFFNIIRW